MVLMWEDRAAKKAACWQDYEERAREQEAGSRRQEAGGRRQEAEGRGQRAEGRGQRAEGRTIIRTPICAKLVDRSGC
jgi:hypothetical protein